MAGDKIVDKSNNVENNSEKNNDNIECHLNLSLDEAFSETVDYVPCPEFCFATSACYTCNGYYGPCFEEPVCATCHAFLFPDDIGLRQVPIFSEKTDDEDSGNDEPTDLCYNAERRVSQQQQPQQQINPQKPVPIIPIPQRVVNEYKPPSNPLLPLNNLPIAPSNQNVAANSAKMYSWGCTGVPQSASNVGTSSNSMEPMPPSNPLLPLNNLPTVAANQNATSSSAKMYSWRGMGVPSSASNVGNERIQEPQNLRMESLEDPHDEEDENLPNLDDVPAVHENIRLAWNLRGYEVGESSRPQNLSERVEMLTNHKHIEHEPINEPGLVERLPPEVLLAVFSYLDDVSLWSAANVCRRWYGLLLTHVPSQQWQQHVKIHWPLYRPIGNVDNWFKVYDRLASSAPCRMCFSLMCLRAEPSRMEENSWRRNRLRGELKSLRIDPPEGIEATPLDQMCCHWQATITGPIGSPYEGGLFYLYLQVPYSYPMCPPVVKFLTKILHPNVSRHGDVGIDSIHHNWSLALTISKVLISVQSLLTDPYCQVCMEPELGEMYMNDRERFEEVARAWTWKYAMHDVVTPT